MSPTAQTPPWFTPDLLQSILRTFKSDPSITISEPCVLEPGTKAGDSFSGALYRTKIRYRSGHDSREHTTSWMLKSESSDALNTDPALFNTEHRMYTEVLPAMQKELIGIGESLSVPGLVYGSERPHRLIVMEDLAFSGWSRMDEIGSFEDALPAVETISKFHAASFLLSKSGMTLTDFSNRTSDGLLLKFQPMFTNYIDAVCSWDEFADIHPQLQQFKENFMEHYKRVYTPNPDPNGYNVLNHGDFHGKNLLHMIDERGKVTNTAALDFQVCSWGSPAIDLVYFLYLVVHRDVLDNHRDQILNKYHKHFGNYLTRMGFQGWIPTLEDLQAELNRHVFFELFHDALGTPFRTVDFAKVSLDDFLAGRVPDVGFRNARYCVNVRRNLAGLVRRGSAFNLSK